MNATWPVDSAFERPVEHAGQADADDPARQMSRRRRQRRRLSFRARQAAGASAVHGRHDGAIPEHIDSTAGHELL
jgi:hypothetical protein